MKVSPQLIARALAIGLLAGLGAAGAFAQAAAVPQPPPVPSAGAPGAEVDLDRNDDKVIDYKVFYDRTGALGREEMDFNFDGVMDTFFYYSGGKL